MSERNPRSTVTVVPSASASSQEDPRVAFLVVIYGSDLGKRVALGDQPVECGRSGDSEIPLEDTAASRRHARFSWDGQRYVVRDLESTNGTFVNDAKVGERGLRDGDQVKVGHTIFKFIQGGNVELAYHEEIYRLMTFDGLTQVHNKRAFGMSLDREVSRSKRYQRPLSVVLFDIDHFKHVNDTKGHLAGDAVLRQLAGAVAAHIRREDIFARVGGEEFGLIVPELHLQAARFVAEKLRSLVERTPFQFDGGYIRVTSSFGVAGMFGEPNKGAADLYQAADEQLYVAKNAGRNCVM